MHRQENFNSSVGFPRCGIPFSNDCKGFRGRPKASGAHARNKRPERREVAETSGNVNGVVVRGGVVGIGGVVRKEVEELEGFGAMVP